VWANSSGTNVGKRRDAGDSGLFGAARQQRDLRASLVEKFLHGTQLQRSDVGRGLIVGRVRSTIISSSWWRIGVMV